jgi:octaprenyl-diphosphate synthase
MASIISLNSSRSRQEGRKDHTGEPLMKLEKIYSAIKKELRRIENELRSQLLSSKDKFILEVNRYLLDSPGKRLRPSLVLLSAKTNNHWDEKVIPVAAALELIHTASLVHDDVLDEADLRRNRATVNTRWGNESAVLTGDYLYLKAFSILSQLEVPKISSIVSFAAGQMCEGEIIQTCKTYKLNLSEEDYLEIIEKKTASLMAASCKVGAILSQSHPSVRKALANYGLNFGMAFQIIDDCLDLTALSDKTGKSTYRDIEQGKMTLPLIYLVKRASKKDRRGLTNLFDRDREEVIDLLKRYETVSLSLQRAKEYIIKAQAQLKTVEDSEARDALWQLGDYLLERTT